MQPARAGARLMDVMARRRLPVLLAAVAALAVLASGCSAASTTRPAVGHAHPATAPPVATASFGGMGLAFRYPAAWRSGTFSDDVSSFTASIVYLSTTRLRDPCTVTNRPGEITKVCGAPIRKLPPGGVLVRWNADGFMGRQLPKANATVGGRPAYEAKTTGPWCTALDGTEMITVMIPRNAADNWYQMDACLHGPGLTQQEAEIASMLNSLRIAKGD